MIDSFIKCTFNIAASNLHAYMFFSYIRQMTCWFLILFYLFIQRNPVVA